MNDKVAPSKRATFSRHLATFILNYVLVKNNLYMFKDIFIWSSNIFKIFWNIVFESILKRCFHKDVFNAFWMIFKKTFSRQLSWDVFSTLNNCFESILKTCFHKDVFNALWMISKKMFSKHLMMIVLKTFSWKSFISHWKHLCENMSLKCFQNIFNMHLNDL